MSARVGFGAASPEADFAGRATAVPPLWDLASVAVATISTTKKADHRTRSFAFCMAHLIRRDCRPALWTNQQPSMMSEPPQSLTNPSAGCGHPNFRDSY